MPTLITFTKLPTRYEVIEFQPAADGWIAYFIDGAEPNPEKLMLRAVPVSMWALVEYDSPTVNGLPATQEQLREVTSDDVEGGDMTQEIRPMVVLTNGKIVDYLDTPTPTTPICVLGPHIQDHPTRVGAILHDLGYELPNAVPIMGN